MKTRKIYTAILGLRHNDSIENDVPYAPRYKKELTTTIFDLKRRGITYGTLEIRYLRKVPERMQPLWTNHIIETSDEGYLKLNFKIDKSKITEIQKIDDRENAQWLLKVIIYHLFVVLNIAKPSAYLSTGGLYYSGNKVFHKITPIHHSMGFAFEKAIETQWPKLNLLSFKQVWDWYFQFDSEILTLPTSPIGRALNAFSHLIRSSATDESYSELLWIMIGLEALYCQGKSKYDEQLNTKTALFLGKRGSFKKKFNKMYGYRSRFIHGRLNLQSQFIYVDDSVDVNQHLDEYWSTRSLALATFIATLQRLVIENRQSNPSFDIPMHSSDA